MNGGAAAVTARQSQAFLADIAHRRAHTFETTFNLECSESLLGRSEFPAHDDGDLPCPWPEYQSEEWGGGMEIWGLGAAAMLALWRYFFDIDWDLRVKRRRRRYGRGRA